MEVAVRDGVGIDRDTGTAREAIKFTFDVAEPHLKFTGKLILENGTETDLALVFILLKEFERGFELGGMKSRGLGLVKLSSYSVRRVEAAGLRQFYLSGTMPIVERGPFETELRAAFTSFCQGKKD
ncbi:MAG: hypothetical protein K2X03_01500 [Bryobacteraceae bacterium]|nr:hypothetical protein [Bryobacteraceae bacterium]